MLLKMNITVYLGASSGNDDKFQIAVRELGNWIGENGHTLVYGGSKAGLMGDLAESVLLSGGKVIGVEPQFFIDAGFEYNDITELIVTHDMSERKAKIGSLGVVKNIEFKIVAYLPRFFMLIFVKFYVFVYRILLYSVI